MRKMITLAAVFFSAVMLLSGPTQAAGFGPAAGLRGAAETINPIDNVACWRYGWHGWGWYPCYVRPGWGYGGWRGRGWGWRGRGWGWRHSDVALKHDIAPVGHLENGLGLYRFSYNGSHKVFVGVLAQDAQKLMPDAVRRGSDGYLSVNYDRLGVPMMTWNEWVAAGQAR